MSSQHRQRKAELKSKLHFLRKASQSENAKRFYHRTVLSSRNVGEEGEGSLSYQDKTLYERHRSMYLKQQGIETRRERVQAAIEKEIFGANKGYNEKQLERKKSGDDVDADDPFFLDMDRDAHRIRYEHSRQKMDQLMSNSEKDDRRLAIEGNKSRFRPYEEQTFVGEDNEMMEFRPSVTSRAGRLVSTPSITRQKDLDPDNWRYNINFLPIPLDKNKLLRRLKQRQAEKKSNEREEMSREEKSENLLHNKEDNAPDNSKVSRKRKRMVDTSESNGPDERVSDDNKDNEESQDTGANDDEQQIGDGNRKRKRKNRKRKPKKKSMASSLFASHKNDKQRYLA